MRFSRTRNFVLNDKKRPFLLFVNLFKSENNRRKREKSDIDKRFRLSKKEQKEELIKWIYFFENPENKKVWGYMKKEEEPEEIKETREKLRAISEDEKMQRIVELRQKAIMDEKAGKEYAKNEGIEVGKNLRKTNQNLLVFLDKKSSN